MAATYLPAPTLANIPEELLVMICRQLDDNDRPNLLRTAKRFKDTLYRENVRVATTKDNFPIYLAIRTGDERLMETTLRLGASVDSLLHSARRPLVVRGMPGGIIFHSGRLPLVTDKAGGPEGPPTRRGCIEIDGVLYTRPHNYFTPLHLALRFGRDEMALLLLGRGASMEDPAWGVCPCMNLPHGFDLDQESFRLSSQGPIYRPLHTALCSGNVHMAAELVRRGASLLTATYEHWRGPDDALLLPWNSWRADKIPEPVSRGKMVAPWTPAEAASRLWLEDHHLMFFEADMNSWCATAQPWIEEDVVLAGMHAADRQAHLDRRIRGGVDNIADDDGLSDEDDGQDSDKNATQKGTDNTAGAGRPSKVKARMALHDAVRFGLPGFIDHLMTTQPGLNIHERDGSDCLARRPIHFLAHCERPAAVVDKVLQTLLRHGAHLESRTHIVRQRRDDVTHFSVSGGYVRCPRSPAFLALMAHSPEENVYRGGYNYKPRGIGALLALARAGADFSVAGLTGVRAISEVCAWAYDAVEVRPHLPEMEAEGDDPEAATTARVCWEDIGELIRLLVKRGACVEDLDNMCETPLCHAASRGRGPLIRILCGAGVGADPNRPCGGISPLERALINWGHTVGMPNDMASAALNAVDALLSAGATLDPAVVRSHVPAFPDEETLIGALLFRYPWFAGPNGMPEWALSRTAFDQATAARLQRRPCTGPHSAVSYMVGRHPGSQPYSFTETLPRHNRPPRASLPIDPVKVHERLAAMWRVLLAHGLDIDAVFSDWRDLFGHTEAGAEFVALVRKHSTVPRPTE